MKILEEQTIKLGIPQIERHIFLCCDQTNPKCCQYEQGMESWEYLKNRLKELNLSQSGNIFRSKVNCLRVCVKGPLAVIYPDKCWYHSCTPEVLEKIIQKHLIDGQIVEEYLFSSPKLNQPK